MLAIVGFNWGGWTLGSTVKKVAKERADSAVVAVLAPIHVDKFHQADATANLSELLRLGSGDIRRKRRVGNNAGGGVT
jgi:hypothetical protein